MRLAPLVASALVAACSSRQSEPVRQVALTHPAPPPPPAAPVDAGAPEAAPRAPRPMQPVLPALSLENLRFRDVFECARGTCSIATLSPLAPASPAAEDGATTLPPAMAWVQVIRPGASVVIPRRASVDLLGVALVGDLSLGLVGSPRAPRRAAPWTAFHMAEGGVVLRAAGVAPVAALLVTAAERAGEAGDAVANDVPRAHGDLSLRELATLPDLAWAGGAMHARIAFEAPTSPRASLGVLFASDDAAVPEHVHPDAWETLVVFSAAGRLHVPAQTVADAGIAVSARDRTVTAGAMVYVPASVRHAWVPDGTHPLIAVQVYSPAGPEQRFRALAPRPRSAPMEQSSP